MLQSLSVRDKISNEDPWTLRVHYLSTAHKRVLRVSMRSMLRSNFSYNKDKRGTRRGWQGCMALLHGLSTVYCLSMKCTMTECFGPASSPLPHADGQLFIRNEINLDKRQCRVSGSGQIRSKLANRSEFRTCFFLSGSEAGRLIWHKNLYAFLQIHTLKWSHSILMTYNSSEKLKTA